MKSELDRILEINRLRKKSKKILENSKEITGKICFEFIINNGYDKLFEFSNEVQMPVQIIEKKALEYRVNASIEDQEKFSKLHNDYYENLKEKLQKSVYSNLSNSIYIKPMEELLSFKTMDDALEYLFREKYSIGALKYQIQSYITRQYALNDENILLKELKLKKVAQAYEKRLEEISENKKEAKIQKDREIAHQKIIDKVNDAIRIAQSWLNSEEETINEYCKKNNINEELFNEAITKLKNKKLSIYDEVFNKRLKYELKEEVENAKIIKYLIVNGIEENGQIREFEQLDFFEHTGKLSIEEFYKIVEKDLTINEIRKIKKFITTSSKIFKSNPEISKTRVCVSIMIDGKNYSSTDKDHFEALTYLIENNIPLYDILYKQKIIRILKEKQEKDKIRKMKLEKN